MRDEAKVFRETCRYLGIRGVPADENLTGKIREGIAALEKAAMERSTYARFPLSVQGTQVTIGGVPAESAKLAKNLAGCETAVLMAVTLGPSVDLLIRRAEITDAALASILQAAGAALAEDLADRVNEEIRREAEASGFFVRPRFSPGYGDFSLSFQETFSRFLNLPKTCGITLTDAFLMAPSKSITALLGLSRENTACAPSGCEACSARRTCAYSRETSPETTVTGDLS